MSRRQVLAEIEELLQALGASKSGLLAERLESARRSPRVWMLFRAPARLVNITVTGLRMRASPSPSPHVQGRPSQG